MVRPKFSVAFGLTVQRHRKRRGLSQEELAEAADVHRTHIGLVERAERNASLDVAERIAAALEMSLSALIADAERRWAEMGGRRTKGS